MIVLIKAYIFNILDWSLGLYSFLLVIYCIAGWFVTNRYVGWYSFLHELFEPTLSWMRKVTGGKLVIERFDLTVLILFLGIEAAQRILALVFF